MKEKKRRFFAYGEHADQTTGQRLNLSLQALNRRLSITNARATTPFPLVAQSPLSDSPFFSQTSRLSAVANLPYFIKPLPIRIGPDEAAYLETKGALTVPSNGLRSELLRAYIEFVHPYMPLIDLYDFVMIIESGSGVLGRISLILFQAVMFAGSAYVDMQHLHNAGYLSRKEARKDFFQRTRVIKSTVLPLFNQLTPASCSMISITSPIAFLWSRPYFCSPTTTKLPMTRRTPGTGWVLLLPWHIPSASIVTRSDRAWTRRKPSSGSVFGGQLI